MINVKELISKRIEICSKQPTKFYIYCTICEIQEKMTGYLQFAPKVGGDNIACVSMFGFPEKMNKQAPGARERIEKELLK